MKILNYNPADRGNQIKNGDEVELFYIIDIEGIKKDTYVLSNYGRVFNINTGAELLMTKRDTGYMVSNLQTGDGRVKNIYPHRVIAKVFIPKTKEDIENNNKYILFKDGDKTNMCYKNMKWVNLRTIRSMANYSKENNRLCSLTVDQVHIICEYLEKGYKYKHILNLLPFKTTYSVICNIASKRSWIDISSLYNIKGRYTKRKKSA